MRPKGLYSLTIDKSFSTLIHPLSQDERQRLEENILRDGCIDPIIVWNNVILDGHNRYSICTRNKIPFAIEDMDFSSKQEALAWICANQLGRRNISDVTRRYLIGKQFEAEKIAGAMKNKTGKNQFQNGDAANNNCDTSLQDGAPPRDTAQIIADKNKVSTATVNRCAAFARAIDRLGEKDPKLMQSILAGEQKLSQHRVIELSSMKPSQICRATMPRTPRGTLSQRENGLVAAGHSEPSVKDMPKYDPDGVLTALTLTIPSWRESIERVITVADMTSVSSTAKNKMQSVLFDLISSAEKLQTIIKSNE